MKEEIKQRFDAWWNHEKTDRPMIKLIRQKPDADFSETTDLKTIIRSNEDIHLNPRVRVEDIRNQTIVWDFLLEAFPYVDMNMGAGSMACYYACNPEFRPDTVWFKEAEIDSLDQLGEVGFEKSTKWFRFHLDRIAEAKRLTRGEFPCTIPDILENLDVLSNIRGPQNLCFDLADDPTCVKKYLDQIDRDYMKYYDAFYDLVREEDGSCVYTAFSIWGRNKTAKLQCDFSCMISEEMYDELVLPYIRRQCEQIPYTLYHVDGKDAIRHVKSLCTIDELKAIQWEPGAGEADCGEEKWFPLYDQVMDAGKSLWLSFGNGDVENWIRRAKKIADRYANRGLYFHFPVCTLDQADRIRKAFGC